MLDLIIYFLIGLVGVLIILLAVTNFRKKNDSSLFLLQQQINSLIQLQQQELNQLREALDQKFSESDKAIKNHYYETINIVKEITEKLTSLDKTNQQVISFSEQLKKLQDVLTNPKQRGILGEYYLETLLKNVLAPGQYQMQYTFSDGTIVDAVIFLEKKVIPIDSKFSLENYNRILESNSEIEKNQYERAFLNDLKNRIEETAKYIKPQEGTMEFAFMFIPSEAVYYDLLINKIGAIESETNNLIYYANKKRVIIVSPTSFLAYLQTVLQGLKTQKISEKAQEIIKAVSKLEMHLMNYGEYLKKLGNNLSATVSAYNKAGKEFFKIGKDVNRIIGKESEEEIVKLEEIEKPLLDEKD